MRAIGGILPEKEAMVWDADRVCRHLEWDKRALDACTRHRIQVVQYEIRQPYSENAFAGQWSIDRLPTVLFLGAEGQELRRCVLPRTQEILCGAIEETARDSSDAPR